MTWVEERRALRVMPAPFDGFAEKSARISATCLVNFERNRYSVECRYAPPLGPVPMRRAKVSMGRSVRGAH